MDSEKTRSFLSKLFLLVLIGLIVFGGYYLFQRSNKAVDPKAALFQEAEKTVEKVGKLMDLPKNEAPTLATVSDKKKLANQTFFQNSENGDKVLIYQKAKKAIIYRPSTNKIIEVGPVNLGQDQAAPPAPTPIASPSATIISQ